MFKRVLLSLCCFGRLFAMQPSSADAVIFEQDSQIVLAYVVGALDGGQSKESAALSWREMTKDMTAEQKQQLVKKAIADTTKSQVGSHYSRCSAHCYSCYACKIFLRKRPRKRSAAGLCTA